MTAPLALLDLAVSATAVFVVPHYEPREGFLMTVLLYRDSVKLFEQTFEFTECSRLLDTLRSQGFHTATVSAKGIILQRSAP